MTGAHNMDMRWQRRLATANLRGMAMRFHRSHVLCPTVRGVLFLLVTTGATPGCDGCGLTPLEDAPALLAPSTTSLDFGLLYAGEQTVRTVELQSLGTSAVHLRSLTFQDAAGVFVLVRDVSGSELAPGSTTPVEVVFNPQSQGDFSGILLVESDARNAGTLSVLLHGIGAEEPSCDDGNPCTTDAFDRTELVCSHTFNTQGCDDHSACTENDHCDNGTCVGTSRACADADPCTRDLCDPQSGCFFFVDPAICDDLNPCTADLCSPARGCFHNTLPDGSWCTDGQFCTAFDRCTNGVCRGTRSTIQPSELGVLEMFGTTQGLVLSDQRLLFLDQDDTDDPTNVTVVFAQSDDLAIQRTTALDVNIVQATRLGPDMVLAQPAIGLPELWRVELDGTLTRTTVPAPEGGSDHAGDLAGTGAAAAYFVKVTTLRVLDFSNPDAPVWGMQLEVPRPTFTNAWATDESQMKLYLRDSMHNIWRLDLTNALAPGAPVLVASDVPFSYYMLANGGTLLLGTAYGFDILNGNTGEFLDSLGGNPFRLQAVGFHNQLLTVARYHPADGDEPLQQGQIHLYDMSAPATPALLDYITGPSQYRGRETGHMSDGLCILPSSPTLSVVRVDPTTRKLQVLDSPSMGAVSSISLVEDQLYALHPGRASTVDISIPSAPLWTASGRLDPPGGILTAGVGPQAVTRVEAQLLGAGRTLHPRYDVTDPASAQVCSLLNTPANISAGGGDGTAVFLLTGGDPAAYRLPLCLGPVQAALAPLAPFEPPEDERSRSLTADPVQHHVLLSQDSPAPAPPGLNLTLFDVADPAVPRLLTHARLADVDLIQDARLAGTAAVLTFFSKVVFVESAVGVGGWIPRGALDMDEATTVVMFDGRVAVLAGRETLYFVETNGAEAVLLGTLATGHRAVGAAVVEDVLVVGSEHRVAVVQPACPPPLP